MDSTPKTRRYPFEPRRSECFLFLRAPRLGLVANIEKKIWRGEVITFLSLRNDRLKPLERPWNYSISYGLDRLHEPINYECFTKVGS